MADFIRDYSAIATAVCVALMLITFAYSIYWLTLLFLGKLHVVG